MEETQKAPSDLGDEKKYEAGPVAGATDLGGPILPALWKLTISGCLPSNNVNAHVELTTGARRCGRSSAATFLLTLAKVDEKDDEKSTSVCDGGGSMVLQVKAEIPKPIAGDMSPE